MKVALVYTSTTPELIELVEKEVGDVLPQETEVASYQDPSILAEVRDTGYVTAPPAARLIGMYMTAVSEGADAILNLCSSVGEVADAAQDIARYPIWVKPYLTIEEAAEYTGIGRDKLYEMTSLADCPFVLWVGNRRMIKRRIFDEYIEQMYSI